MNIKSYNYFTEDIPENNQQNEFKTDFALRPSPTTRRRR
jgi:hypothetical protein